VPLLPIQDGGSLTAMKVAKQGYSFFSVTAPGVFIEYELPTMLGQLEPMNDEEAAHWEELVAAANRYGVRIESNKHSRGTAN
jgi:hypothetical protein